MYASDFLFSLIQVSHDVICNYLTSVIPLCFLSSGISYSDHSFFSISISFPIVFFFLSYLLISAGIHLP